MGEFKLSERVMDEIDDGEMTGRVGIKECLGSLQIIVGDIKSRMQPGQEFTLASDGSHLQRAQAQYRREAYYSLRKRLISTFGDNGTQHYVRVSEGKDGDIRLTIQKSKGVPHISQAVRNIDFSHLKHSDDAGLVIDGGYL